uniref:Uncharacterized protein n=1 Tax=Avena sativa TaxID=4498 RepID=A0ACD5WAV2_AVESA
MGALWSSPSDAIRAKNHTQHSSRRLDAVDCWSSLPEDLLLLIMAALDTPALVRSGAVCTSWHDAYSTHFRVPSPEQGPCLLYACEEYGPSHAALYCPSTGATFRVPFQHHGKGRFLSSNGWVLATDEAADPYLLNPITGVKAALPSVKTLPGIHSFCSSSTESFSEDDIRWARDSAYLRVAISTGHDHDVTACTVLLVHLPRENLSFARPGDERWTLLSDELCLSDVRYNDKDGMFYGLSFDGSVYVLDLSGGGPSPSPAVTTKIMCEVTRWGNPTKYLVITPSGELWQIWRIWTEADTELEDRWTYQHVLYFTDEAGHVDFIGEDDDDDETDGGVVKPRLDGMDNIEVTTCKVLIFKVDTDRQKLVEMRSIGEHALFLGYNSAVCVSTMDFPAFEPNRAYLSDDCSMYGQILRRDLGIWNFEKRSLRNLGDAWPNRLFSWLELLAPVWITPSLG